MNYSVSSFSSITHFLELIPSETGEITKQRNWRNTYEERERNTEDIKKWEDTKKKWLIWRKWRNAEWRLNKGREKTEQRVAEIQIIEQRYTEKIRDEEGKGNK